MADENNLETTQLVKVEQLSLSSMDMQQKRMAERLYSQLGLDPVVENVLKEYQTRLKGMDKATDRVFGPFDIKGRAESVAKVASLMTYTALHQQYSQELEGLQHQMDQVEGQRDKERANYDSLVMKVADIVGGDYDELKANYDEVVQRLSDVEHLKSQTTVLNKEKSDLAERYETLLAEAQKDRAETVARYEAQLSALREDQRSAVEDLKAQIAQTVARYEAQLSALRDEHRAAADDLRAQIAEKGTRVAALEGEKAEVTAERDGLLVQVAELKSYQADLEARLAGLNADHDRLKSAAGSLKADVDCQEIGKRLSADMHAFMLADSKVPHAVIDGVGKFLDFKKYLGHAAESGAREAAKEAENKLGAMS